MKTTQILSTAAGYAWRLPLCAGAYVVGAAASAVLVTKLGLPLPQVPEQANEQTMTLCLVLASAGTIVLIQFLRSGLFLLVALPILIAGIGPRRHLILALGLAFYVLVGLFSMIQTYWLAPTLLVLHNLEIFADSMVYALALTLLLMHGSEARANGLFTRLPLYLERATIEE